MTTKVVPGQLVATRDVAEAAHEAATRLARALKSALKLDGTASIALSGGSTPREAYRLLAREAGIDWSKVNVFFVDERAVPPTDERSNYRLVKETILDSVPAARVHRMQGEATDLAAAATAYEAEVRAAVRLGPDGVPAFDVVLLGVGEDGHTASLFPGEKEIDVTDKLVVPVAAKGSREARLTITTPAIEHARSVFVLAVGRVKSPALERTWAVNGDVHETPARLVRGARGAVTWIIDRAAGGISS